MTIGAVGPTLVNVQWNVDMESRTDLGNVTARVIPALDRPMKLKFATLSTVLCQVTKLHPVLLLDVKGVGLCLQSLHVDLDIRFT